MLFETYGQINVFIAFIWLGLLLKIIYDLFGFSSNIKKICFDFIFFIMGGLIFIIFVHYFNLGKFRFFLCIGLLMGVLIEKIFFAKTLVTFKKLLYNYFIKIFTKVKNNYIITLSTKNKKTRQVKKCQRTKNTPHSFAKASSKQK